MIAATYEELLTMKIGTPIVVNTKNDIADFALFMGFDKEKGEILAADCVLKSKTGSYSVNVYTYSECLIVPTDRNELLKFLQKKM